MQIDLHSLTWLHARSNKAYLFLDDGAPQSGCGVRCVDTSDSEVTTRCSENYARRAGAAQPYRRAMKAPSRVSKRHIPAMNRGGRARSRAQEPRNEAALAVINSARNSRTSSRRRHGAARREPLRACAAPRPVRHDDSRGGSPANRARAAAARGGAVPPDSSVTWVTMRRELAVDGRAATRSSARCTESIRW
jgi:hypothetical protein